MALADIADGANIIRYGEVIGTASSDIKRGDWINEDNVVMGTAPPGPVGDGDPPTAETRTADRLQFLKAIAMPMVRWAQRIFTPGLRSVQCVDALRMLQVILEPCTYHRRPLYSGNRQQLSSSRGVYRLHPSSRR